jgi:hypothetical protein
MNAHIAKLRVYQIDDDQDNAAPVIRGNFPNLLYISNGKSGGTFDAMRGEARWGACGRKEVPSPWYCPAWLQENVKTNHGPLGANYPFGAISEGDSPSILHMFQNGLCAFDHPSYGGWGGRFFKESGNFWRDVNREVNGVVWYDILRWIAEYSNDFASRMDYFVKSYEEANHPPQIVVDSPLDRAVKPGTSIKISAEGTTDPDGDNLTYKWWHFKEAGLTPVSADVAIGGNTTRNASFTVPNENGKQFHIICEVKDNGNPPITRYKRFVFNIDVNAPAETPAGSALLPVGVQCAKLSVVAGNLVVGIASASSFVVTLTDARGGVVRIGRGVGPANCAIPSKRFASGTYLLTITEGAARYSRIIAL